MSMLVLGNPWGMMSLDPLVASYSSNSSKQLVVVGAVVVVVRENWGEGGFEEIAVNYKLVKRV